MPLAPHSPSPTKTASLPIAAEPTVHAGMPPVPASEQAVAHLLCRSHSKTSMRIVRMAPGSHCK